jgi:hypothetical protein
MNEAKFSALELQWAEEYSGVAAADPYDAVAQVIPVAEFESAACIFNPVTDSRTGNLVDWPTAAGTESIDATCIALIERASRGLEIPGWRANMVPPTEGRIDGHVWFAIAKLLNREMPLRAVLFPTAPPPQDLTLDLTGLEHRLLHSRLSPPVMWWPADHSMIVASPYDSIMTYISGSAAMLRNLNLPSGVSMEILKR